MTEGEPDRASLSFERSANGVAVVRFDVPGEPVNTLRAEFASELTSVFAELERDANLTAVLLTSGKPDSFSAGAEIEMLRSVERAEQATTLSRAGQRALAIIADFRVPVVAAIHGACLGGGLELCLACTARVATSDERTKLGFPEVHWGVLPALGGTQRLPHLIGLENALDLLLTGKQVDGKHALRLGLIDELVAPSILLEVAARLALARASSRPKQARSIRRLPSISALREFALAENPIGRKIVFDRAKRQLLGKTHGNYPAAERVLTVVKLGLAKGFGAGLEAEAQAFAELVVSEEARALMHVFFASTALKKDPGRDLASIIQRPVRHVAVLGAGLMGAGIAYVSAARANVSVRLKDRDEAALGRGLQYVRDVLDERAKSRRISETERDSVMNRLTATTDYSGIESADVVIEAAFEDLELKRRLLAEVEAHAGKRVIFASSTSSLPIASVAAGARRPEHVLGMHYFSPVQKVPLLEVVTTQMTLPWVIATAVELGRRQGKMVIVVGDSAGFYTSRILGPYLNEASLLLAEGVPIEQIDRALVQWGFPVGPITLLDEVGIDVSARVGHVLHGAFGDRLTPPPVIERLLTDQRLGKKNQRGFYLYGDAKKGDREVDRSVYALLSVEPTRELPAREIAQRCALQMVNEAARVFGEGILQSARDGDIGAVFGLGFPSFRGGPFHYMDALGAAEIVRQLESYRSALGPRFTPAPILLELAETGAAFYGARAVEPGRHRV